MVVEGFRERICWMRASSLEAVREMRKREYLERASWSANSLPMPSEAPVMTTQDFGGPKEES